MKAAVIGVGHLGKHHARILAAMPGVSLAGVVDVNRDRAAKIAGEYGTRAFGNVSAAIADASPAHDRIGDLLVEEAEKNFDSEGGAKRFRRIESAADGDAVKWRGIIRQDGFALIAPAAQDGFDATQCEVIFGEGFCVAFRQHSFATSPLKGVQGVRFAPRMLKA